MSSRDFGFNAEETAARFLSDNGYKILVRNYRERFGEIDIIAQHMGVIIFVEVKARTSNYFGSPLEAIGRKKLQSIIITSQMYLSKSKKVNSSIRYDAIEVFKKQDGIFSIDHVKNITM